ncbi:MAG: indole-3-glycerol phosphate synthase TrpC [Candidatus Anammoxibacter sp.]
MRIYEILDKKKEEIKEAKTLRPFNELKKIVADKQAATRQNGKDGNCNFLNALKNIKRNTGNNSGGDDSSSDRTKIIAEIKQASPSKGVLRNNFDPEDIARSYKKHHAAAISVLTIRYGFNGDIEYLVKVKEATDIPVLRKDFIFEEYQIYESRAFDADAILLIASILDEQQLSEYLDLTKELGMDALTEVHSLEDLEKAINCNAEIIGINNRNLKTFDVDINTTLSLIKEVPKGRIIVSESGIKTRDDIELLENNGVNAFLIGTALMKSDNIGNELDKLLGL